MNLILQSDRYWINLVYQIATASTCRVDVGCVLVQNQLIVGTGYSGSISGDFHCAEVGCMLVETEIHGSSEKKESCIRTVHAEMNAVLKCTARGNNHNGWLTAYTTHQPCLRCFQALLQIGVRTIVYDRPYRDLWRDKLLEKIKTPFVMRKFDMHEPVVQKR